MNLVRFRDDFSPDLAGITFTTVGEPRLAAKDGRAFVEIESTGLFPATDEDGEELPPARIHRLAWVEDLRPADADTAAS